MNNFMKRRKSTPFQIHRRDVIIPSLEKEGLNTVVYAHRRRATIALVTIGRVRMRVHIHSQTRGRMHKRREVNGTLENKRRIAHEFHTHSTTLIVLLHTYYRNSVYTRACVTRSSNIIGAIFRLLPFFNPLPPCPLFAAAREMHRKCRSGGSGGEGEGRQRDCCRRVASPFLFMALFAPSASLLERLSETACSPSPPGLFLDRFAFRALYRIPRNLFLVDSSFFLGENWNTRRLRFRLEDEMYVRGQTIEGILEDYNFLFLNIYFNILIECWIILCALFENEFRDYARGQSSL